MIFVQIASYRDPELLPTIVDCLSKAKYPNDIRFGICWQRHEKDKTLSPLMGHQQFSVVDVPWNESKGLCWARSRIQQLYRGEEFTMQLDSHHRFCQNWDAQLIEDMELTGSSKPLIGSYAGMYDPRTNEKINNDPYTMVATRFSDHGTIPFRPESIRGWEELAKPVRARFVSGHFFFTLGQHCQDYVYDPNLYFAGDEISLSIRSFTLGYDLFHPHRLLVWHEYTRRGRTKHWDDHTTENKALVAQPWHERDVLSKRRLRKLLREEENDEDISGYDLGSVRSHQDYERYAGIDFKGRRLQRDTLAGVEPPCTFVDDVQWERGFTSRSKVELKWNPEDLAPCDDLNFLYMGVEDENGKVLHRYDAPVDSPEAQGVVRNKEIEVFLDACTKPVSLILWPHSLSRGWLKKSVFSI